MKLDEIKLSRAKRLLKENNYLVQEDSPLFKVVTKEQFFRFQEESEKCKKIHSAITDMSNLSAAYKINKCRSILGLEVRTRKQRVN